MICGTVRNVLSVILSPTELETFECNLNLVLVTKLCLQKLNRHLQIPYVLLKRLQFQCLSVACLETKDILACLPTGYGKSLIYTLLPILDMIIGSVCEPVAIIIAPLNAIIHEQVVRLPSAIKAELDEVTMDNLRQPDHKFRYIIGFPEVFLSKKFVDNCLKNIESRVTWIVVDEAHCILQWGPNFRKEFENICKLRAVFPSARFLALTATATITAQNEIAGKLLMTVSVTYIMLTFSV